MDAAVKGPKQIGHEIVVNNDFGDTTEAGLHFVDVVRLIGSCCQVLMGEVKEAKRETAANASLGHGELPAGDETPVASYRIFEEMIVTWSPEKRIPYAFEETKDQVHGIAETEDLVTIDAQDDPVVIGQAVDQQGLQVVAVTHEDKIGRKRVNPFLEFPREDLRVERLLVEWEHLDCDRQRLADDTPGKILVETGHE
jgi:hypothetical protein